MTTTLAPVDLTLVMTDVKVRRADRPTVRGLFAEAVQGGGTLNTINVRRGPLSTRYEEIEISGPTELVSRLTDEFLALLG